MVQSPLTKLEERITALQKAIDNLRSDVDENIELLRIIITMMHPDPDHPIADDTVLYGGMTVHQIHEEFMKWIEHYGRYDFGAET